MGDREATRFRPFGGMRADSQDWSEGSVQMPDVAFLAGAVGAFALIYLALEFLWRA